MRDASGTSSKYMHNQLRMHRHITCSTIGPSAKSARPGLKGGASKIVLTKLKVSDPATLEDSSRKMTHHRAAIAIIIGTSDHNPGQQWACYIVLTDAMQQCTCMKHSLNTAGGFPSTLNTNQHMIRISRIRPLQGPLAMPSKTPSTLAWETIQNHGCLDIA